MHTISRALVRSSFVNSSKISSIHQQTRRFSHESAGPISSKRNKILALGALGSAVFAYIIFGSENAQNATKAPSTNDTSVISQVKAEPGKPRIVVLGSGWAGLQFVRNIDTDVYDVTLVSPKNYFLYTPLLTEATTGSVELRSLIEPVRKFLTKHGPSVRFFEAACTNVDIYNNRITCEDNSDVKGGKFVLGYDKLVIAVGSVPNTLGTTGVKENCFFLKEPQDAIQIRDRIMDCFETAYHPNRSMEEIKKLLHFVVVGGGPTGVEFAGELHDLVHEDIRKFFPDVVDHVTISIVQSGDHILNSFDLSLQTYTENRFLKEGIHVHTNTRVNEVRDGALVLLDKHKNATETLPFGLCVWAAGVGPNPLVTAVCDSIPTQSHNRALVTDEFLRVKGTPNVYAIGDCSTVTQRKLLSDFVQLFREADVDQDGYLSLNEFKQLIKSHSEQYPQIATYGKHIIDKFKEADADHDGQLDAYEFKKMLEIIDKNLKTYPATAQVASQQGIYLANAMNSSAKNEKPKEFAYKHFGWFAYIGGEAAVADIPGYLKSGGFLVWWLYRSAYFTKQLSWKNRVCLTFDWLKAIFFGRDISRV